MRILKDWFMKTKYCTLCRQTTGRQRFIGIGTLLLVLFTGGFWALVIPFYKVRCIKCGTP